MTTSTAHGFVAPAVAAVRAPTRRCHPGAAARARAHRRARFVTAFATAVCTSGRRGVLRRGPPQLSREGLWMAATLALWQRERRSVTPAPRRSGASAGSEPARSSTCRCRRVYERRRPGIRVHRVSSWSGDVVERDGIPRGLPARTLLNQARRDLGRELEADVNAADIHGLITPDGAADGSSADFGVAGVVALRDVLDRHTFRLTDSELERLFLPLTARAGLALPADPPAGERVQGRLLLAGPRPGGRDRRPSLPPHAAQQARDLHPRADAPGGRAWRHCALPTGRWRTTSRG